MRDIVKAKQSSAEIRELWPKLPNEVELELGQLKGG